MVLSLFFKLLSSDSEKPSPNEHLVYDSTSTKISYSSKYSSILQEIEMMTHKFQGIVIDSAYDWNVTDRESQGAYKKWQTLTIMSMPLLSKINYIVDTNDPKSIPDVINATVQLVRAQKQAKEAVIQRM